MWQHCSLTVTWVVLFIAAVSGHRERRQAVNPFFPPPSTLSNLRGRHFNAAASIGQSPPNTLAVGPSLADTMALGGGNNIPGLRSRVQMGVGATPDQFNFVQGIPGGFGNMGPNFGPNMGPMGPSMDQFSNVLPGQFRNGPMFEQIMGFNPPGNQFPGDLQIPPGFGSRARNDLFDRAWLRGRNSLSTFGRDLGRGFGPGNAPFRTGGSGIGPMMWPERSNSLFGTDTLLVMGPPGFRGNVASQVSISNPNTGSLSNIGIGGTPTDSVAAGVSTTTVIDPATGQRKTVPVFIDPEPHVHDPGEMHVHTNSNPGAGAAPSAGGNTRAELNTDPHVDVHPNPHVHIYKDHVDVHTKAHVHVHPEPHVEVKTTRGDQSSFATLASSSATLQQSGVITLSQRRQQQPINWNRRREFAPLPFQAPPRPGGAIVDAVINMAMQSALSG